MDWYHKLSEDQRASLDVLHTLTSGYCTRLEVFDGLYNGRASIPIELHHKSRQHE